MPDGLDIVGLTAKGCVVSFSLATGQMDENMCFPNVNFYGSSVAVAPPDGATIVVAHLAESRVFIINSTAEVLIIGGPYTSPWSNPSTCWHFPDETYRDGFGTNARFNKPSDLTVTPDGLMIILADRCNSGIWLISIEKGRGELIVTDPAELQRPHLDGRSKIYCVLA